jgi:1,4-alpha-glucan branching enzyme
MDESKQVLVFERGPLVFVLNFSPDKDYEGLEVAVPVPGKWKVALDSDAWDFGGKGRVGHEVDHFSEPASSVVKDGGLFHDRGQLMRVLSPSRTAVVYYRVDEEAERREREERERKRVEVEGKAREEEVRLRERQLREKDEAQAMMKPTVKITEPPPEGML